MGGIRAEITDHGGIWVERIEADNSAVVMGAEPSAAKVSRAKGFDMEVLSPESIETIYTVHWARKSQGDA